MLLTEFISEIHTDLSSYSDSSDIDNNSVKLWVISCLRKLGVNICQIEEDIVTVANSQGRLKDSFRALKLALELEPIGCQGKENLRTDNYIYRQRIENPAYFSQITGEYITSCKSKIITETITIGENKTDFFYNYRWLSLVKGIDKRLLSTDCLNLHPAIRNSYKNQITITGNTLNANFREGNIYLQYYALPNIDGELVIPEITTLDIFEWIKMYVKVQIAENIIANNKNPQGLLQLYPLWMQQLPLLKSAALKEAKFSSISKDWHKKYKAQSKLEFAKFNLPKLN